MVRLNVAERITNTKFLWVITFLLLIAGLMVSAPAKAIENEITYTGLNSNIYGDDGHSGGQKGPFDLGFDFQFFDTQYISGDDARVNININGALTFGPYYTAFSNGALNGAGQNNTIFPFWDDLTAYANNNNAIYYATIGEAPNRKFIVQWTNVYFYNTTVQMGTFQTILYEGSNDIQLQYRDLLGGNRALGNSATVGIKKDNFTFHQYSNNTASLTEGQAIRYSHDGSDNYTVNNNSDYDPVYLIPAGAPASPVLVNPTDGTTGITTTPTFEWLPVEGATSYVVLISTASNFSSTVVNQSGITGTSYTHGSPLNTNTQYYWRVQSVNSIGSSLSATRTFTTASVANSPPEIEGIGASVYTNGDTVTQSQLMTQPLSLTLSDPDEEQEVRYRLQISKQSNFSDLVLDFRSSFGEPGQKSFTLGQGDGTYLVGDADTVLDPNAEYYLRVRAEDEAAASSAWAGPDGVAFVIIEGQEEPEPEIDEEEGVTDEPPLDSDDANNDGTPDAEQSNVETIINPVSNKRVVIELDEVCEIESLSTTPVDDNSAQDSGYTYKNGLMNFTADCGTPGYETTVTLYHYGVATADLVVRKHNPNTNEYFTISGASLSEQTISNQPVAVATFTIKDGGRLDIDGEENGVIVDPVGLASAVGPSGSLADTGENRRLLAVLVSVLMGASALVLAQTRRLTV